MKKSLKTFKILRLVSWLIMLFLFGYCILKESQSQEFNIFILVTAVIIGVLLFVINTIITDIKQTIKQHSL